MDWTQELELLEGTIRAAGAEALRLADDGFETIKKSDQSPVTSADLAVNRILHTHLLSVFPHDGWLSEESPDDAVRLQKDRVWVVDPIDGTKAFINKVPEFCISVALIEHGQPIVAVIYNPSTKELLSATRGGGLRLNRKLVDSLQPNTRQQPVIGLSSWERQIGRFAALEATTQYRPMLSIAWSLALMACGHIDAVATCEPENEWDVAAGVLLINEAGGTITDGSGQPLTFNRPTPRYRGIIATSPCCPDSLAQELSRLVPASG
ncbi:MAG TPA: 3'(2'),5'-bisphosphate nucleotidase CysQ [Nitrospira sp.]|nr:3'(2'),5'-bisphosphate nucleotidase CysQ [Nitrospira sp.]